MSKDEDNIEKYIVFSIFKEIYIKGILNNAQEITTQEVCSHYEPVSIHDLCGSSFTHYVFLEI